MKLIYNVLIQLYQLAIRIASLFNPKAKLWVDGRKDILHKIKSEIQDSTSEIIWFHCASLGEFEQGRVLIEKIKKETKHKVLLTFFSPSGYEVRKNYEGADYIFYLPMDTKSNAQQFVSIVNPTKVFFVKYEFWFNYLRELKKQNIPTYLISGIFRENHYFFKSYGNWFRKQLSAFTHFFLQDKNSKLLLNKINYNNTTVCGDTRFDRVWEISKNVKHIDFIKEFIQNKKVIIGGSTWKEDEEIIANAKIDFDKYCIIIAPHEIHENHLSEIEKLFEAQKTIRYSKLNATNASKYNVLIIDNIGMLSSLYQYGTFAFIGGGFGKGIHNILEAATFGLPIVFGTNYAKFQEAKELIALGGAFTIHSEIELQKVMTEKLANDNYSKCSIIAQYYVASRVGASKLIFQKIFTSQK